MPKKTYTSAEKESALKLCDEIGAPKASEQTGIALNSLYAWRRARNEVKPAVVSKAKTQAVVPAENKESKDCVHKQEGVCGAENEELIRLRVENEALKAQVKTLQNALRAFAE